MARKDFKNQPVSKEKEFDERVLEVSRVSRTVKGGKRLRFRALVIVGDRKGRVGIGLGKAQEVAQAISKATIKAKKHLINVPLVNGTIPSEVNISYVSSRVILKPASPGTSIIAGGSVRTILGLAGVKNILSKIIGSTNKINTAMATILALKKIGQNKGLAKEKPKNEKVGSTPAAEKTKTPKKTGKAKILKSRKRSSSRKNLKR